ncbi:MAG: protein kinase [Deltaproteobacteria bacterium]|nr:protein kinase [Deltaproteobacteria bacterium]
MIMHPTTPSPPTLVGTRFGRYEVEARIAAGGMAEVWRARLTGSAGFEKRVALKTLLPDLGKSDELVRMFIGEAALAAEITHPNVVQVFDFGCKDGRYFMAMEYVAGRSLRQLLQASQHAGARRLPAWVLLEMGLQVCDGLEHIHAFHDANGQPMGLVHRDVSPENIMISWSGTVKLIDFGVAKVVEAAGMASGPVAGKPRYMAPEQALGLDIDARADLCSLGVVMYACATGRLPFSGKDAQEVMQAVVQGRCPPVGKLNPQARPELIALIEHAMATDRGERTPNTADLRRELLGWARAADLDPMARRLGPLVTALAKDDEDLPPALRKHAKSLQLGNLLFDSSNHSPAPDPAHAEAPPIPAQTSGTARKSASSAPRRDRTRPSLPPTAQPPVETLPQLPSALIAPLPAADAKLTPARPVAAPAAPAGDSAPAAARSEPPPVPGRRVQRDTHTGWGLPGLPQELTGPLTSPTPAPPAPPATPARDTGKVRAVTGPVPQIAASDSYPELDAWIRPSKSQQPPSRTSQPVSGISAAATDAPASPSTAPSLESPRQAERRTGTGKWAAVLSERADASETREPEPRPTTGKWAAVGSEPAVAPAAPSPSGWTAFGQRESRPLWGVPSEPTPPPVAEPAEPEIPAEAEQMFEKGLAAFQRHHWQQAVDCWERACAMAPGNRGWAFNLARAKQKLEGGQG